MKTDPRKSLLHDLKKIATPTIRAEIDKAVLAVIEARTTYDIPNLKKLKGYRIHYRIRVGQYRIGITIEGDLVTFVRCLPRKDFYKVFP